MSANPRKQYDLDIPEYGILGLKFGVFFILRKGCDRFFRVSSLEL